MKKLLAAFLAIALIFCFAACGEKTEEDPTRSQEELIADANDAAAKLAAYKQSLDKQLILVNSADNADGFFDLAGMVAAGAQLDKVIEQIDFGSAALTNGDASLYDNIDDAKQAAEQIRAIADKVNRAAAKYYAQFTKTFPGAEMTKMYCLTVFMSGEPSNFFAADYTDAKGNNKTVYSISSFTAETPESMLSTITEFLFADAPVAARNAVTDGNFNIDLHAVRAAVSNTVTEDKTAE